MATNTKIKILAVGNQTMLQRLSARLNQNEVCFKCCSTAYDLPEILQQEPFDMIIVDNLFIDTEAVCKNAVNAGKMPVAVMFNKYGIDWKKLRTMEVDGYFPEEAGSPELMARIKAFSRRRQGKGLTISA
jgi:DNA-binding response OmpR family regulator